jgi:hypothetical protein
VAKAAGTIRCSVKKPDSDQNWWMVLDCNTEEIGRYYRHLYWMDHCKGTKLSKPYWGAHITVVRNEEPPNKDLWWNYDGERIEFDYSPYVRTNLSDERFRSFWWVDVICPRFEEIRVELGLPKNSDGVYHMTIGSRDNGANRHIYEQMWAANQDISECQIDDA